MPFTRLADGLICAPSAHGAACACEFLSGSLSIRLNPPCPPADPRAPSGPASGLVAGGKIAPEKMAAVSLGWEVGMRVKRRLLGVRKRDRADRAPLWRRYIHFTGLKSAACLPGRSDKRGFGLCFQRQGWLASIVKACQEERALFAMLTFALDGILTHVIMSKVKCK